MKLFTAAISLLVSIIITSTIFFRIVEGWSWIDSYFFTVVTLSTVGYGNMVPETSLGKIATTVLIFVGVGAFAYAITRFGDYAVHRRDKRHGWLQHRLEDLHMRHHDKH